MPSTIGLADPDSIQHLFDISQNLEPTAVITQIVLMTGLSIFTILAFDLLRPTNKYVYEPKTIYHAPNKKPPRISSSLWGWLPPLFHNNEQDLFNKIGLDALTFLRFLRLMRWLFTFTAIVTCGALIPLNRLYTVSTNPPLYNFLTSLTIRDMHGARLYAHIGCVYIITLALMVLLYFHWIEMYQLRKQWFRSKEYQNAFYARTLLITDIPPKYRSEEGLWKIFQGMELKLQVTSVHIGKAVGMLPHLIESHNQNVREFETVLTRHMKKSSRREKRPTIRIGGFCGFGGTRNDAIKHYTTKIQYSAAAVEQYRAQMHDHQPENYGFASMASIPAAHGAAYDLRKEQPKGMTIKLAPNPNDIFWLNIALPKSERHFRIVTGFTVLLFLCLFSLIPLFPIASLANLNVLARSGAVPSLRTWIISSPRTYAIVTGVVPPAVAALFSFFLPRLMRRLSKYMGANTHTTLDGVVVARYFTFMIISHLIIFTIIGVIYNATLELITILQVQKVTLTIAWDNLNKLPARMTRTYVDQSTFWLTWLALRGFLVFMDLAQLNNLIWTSIKTWVFGLTPREVRERSKPPLFEYDINYADFLFIAAVGMVFAPLAPLVPLAAAIVFWISSFVYKYQLVYVFVTRVESGGRPWNAVVNRIIFSALFMQVIMIFTIGLQIEFKSLQLLLAGPPPILTLLYKHYLNTRFANDFHYFLPQHDELSRAIIHSEEIDMVGRKLEVRYDHPALQNQLITPMIHAKAMDYLQCLLKGKVRQADLSEKKSMSTTVNKIEDVLGVPITPVHDDELRCDPIQYGRDCEDSCDIDVAHSIFSSHESAPWRQPHVHDFTHRNQPSTSPANTLPGISGQYPSITSSTSSYKTAADNYDVDRGTGPSSSARQHHPLREGRSHS